MSKNQSYNIEQLKVALSEILDKYGLEVFINRKIYFLLCGLLPKLKAEQDVIHFFESKAILSTLAQLKNGNLSESEFTYNDCLELLTGNCPYSQKEIRPVLKPFKDYAESYKYHKSEKHEMQTYCVDCDIVKIESEIA